MRCGGFLAVFDAVAGTGAAGATGDSSSRPSCARAVLGRAGGHEWTATCLGAPLAQSEIATDVLYLHSRAREHVMKKAGARAWRRHRRTRLDVPDEMLPDLRATVCLKAAPHPQSPTVYLRHVALYDGQQLLRRGQRDAFVHAAPSRLHRIARAATAAGTDRLVSCAPISWSNQPRTLSASSRCGSPSLLARQPASSARRGQRASFEQAAMAVCLSLCVPCDQTRAKFLRAAQRCMLLLRMRNG